MQAIRIVPLDNNSQTLELALRLTEEFRAFEEKASCTYYSTGDYEADCEMNAITTHVIFVSGYVISKEQYSSYFEAAKEKIDEFLELSERLNPEQIRWISLIGEASGVHIWDIEEAGEDGYAFEQLSGLTNSKFLVRGCLAADLHLWHFNNANCDGHQWRRFLRLSTEKKIEGTYSNKRGSDPYRYSERKFLPQARAPGPCVSVQTSQKKEPENTQHDEVGFNPILLMLAT